MPGKDSYPKRERKKFYNVQTNYSEKFITRYRELFARLGNDRDCLNYLKEEFGHEYPFLTIKKISLIRFKRGDQFDAARNKFIADMKTEIGKKEYKLSLRGRGVNMKLVEALISQQENILERVASAGVTDSEKDALIGKAIRMQENINEFSGVNAQNQIQIFRRKLLDKKLIDESLDVNKIMSIFDMVNYVGLNHEMEESKPKILEQGNDV